MGYEFIKPARDVEVVWESDLTAEERAEHDYLDWDAMQRGEESAQFVRYEGVCYLLRDFQANWAEASETRGLPSEFAGWDGYLSNSFFSGVVIRYRRGDDELVVDLATFIAKD